jgi:hypothetical protein
MNKNMNPFSANMEKLVNNTILADLPAKVVVSLEAKVEYKMLILDSNVFILDST